MSKLQKRFFRLVKELTESGIIDALHNVSTLKDYENVWTQFQENNSELVTRAKVWGEKFSQNKQYIIESEDKISNPIAVALVIELIGTWDCASERNIFRDHGNKLTITLKKMDDTLATIIIGYMKDNCLGAGTLFSDIGNDDD